MTMNSYSFYRKRAVYLPDGQSADTNDWRADTVRPLLRAFRKQYALGEPESQTLTDLITNLLHLADRIGNWSNEPTSPPALEILELARTCYLTEFDMEEIRITEQNARDIAMATRLIARYDDTASTSTAHLEYPQD